MLLAGKKVVVVGGSSGIGLSTAEMAKREGAEIIIASRNAERLDIALGNHEDRAVGTHGKRGAQRFLALLFAD